MVMSDLNFDVVLDGGKVLGDFGEKTRFRDMDYTELSIALPKVMGQLGTLLSTQVCHARFCFVPRVNDVFCWFSKCLSILWVILPPPPLLMCFCCFIPLFFYLCVCCTFRTLSRHSWVW